MSLRNERGKQLICTQKKYASFVLPLMKEWVPTVFMMHLPMGHPCTKILRLENLSLNLIARIPMGKKYRQLLSTVIEPISRIHLPKDLFVVRNF